MRHVSCAHLEQIVEIAGNHVTAFDLRQTPCCCIEAVKHIGGGALQLYLDEGDVGIAEPHHIKFGMVSPDQPVLFQPPDALGARRLRQADQFGKLGHRNSALCLQGLQNVPVDPVHGCLCSQSGKQVTG